MLRKQNCTLTIGFPSVAHPSLYLHVKFWTRIAAYNEVMTDCDELTLLANRAAYIAKAQSSDVREIRQTIDAMKQEALTLNAELEVLLKENEIRAQVASLNALPTRDALQAYVLPPLCTFRIDYDELSMQFCAVVADLESFSFYGLTIDRLSMCSSCEMDGFSAYDMEMERELKPIEVQKALVARKVALHRKHLGVLLAAIQQMESELEMDHQFTDFP